MPKVDSTSAVPTTAQLSPAKQKLLAQWQRGQANRLAAQDGQQNGQANGKATGDTLARRTQQSTLPLSYAQQRLWFLAQMGKSATYHIPLTFQIVGDLDVTALHRALAEIVQRHESLRTTFHANGTTVEQRIQPDVNLALPVIDLGEHPDARAVALQMADRAAAQPFDLQYDLPLRAQLLRIAAQEHLLLLTFHHIASDGWSFGVLMHELRTLYPLFRQGKASTLPPLSIQYADFALWQRRYLQGETYTNLLHYWKNQLAGAAELLQLPTDRPRPEQALDPGAVHCFQFEPTVMAKVNALSQQNGATPFMTLLAAFYVLLARYSGQEDLLVGTPVANRNRPELEPLIGCFVNMLVLRANVGHQPTFRSLLRQVRQTTLEAYEHQDLPFDRLVEALQTARHLNYEPLFQVSFALQNATQETFTLPGLQVTELPVQTEHRFVDLALHLSEVKGRLQGLWEYRSDLFDPQTIERLSAYYQTLIASIVAHPDAPIATLNLLPPAERGQVLNEWNATQQIYPQQLGIHQLFEAQVERTPEAIALRGTESASAYEMKESQFRTPHSAFRMPPSLTYRELNTRANQLAHYLRQQGVGSTLGAETLVGVCVNDAATFVLSLLALLKAGGVYVPLDPTQPPDRLAAIIAETQLALVITQQAAANKLPPHTAHCVELEQDWAQIAQECGCNPAVASHPDHLAYVIFTSGSTGKPKGIQIEHGGLVNHSYAIINAYRLTPQDRVLQFASTSFDVCLEEIFPTWLAGGTLVLRPKGTLAVVELLRFVEQENVTVLNLPVGYWHEWVLQLDHAPVPPSVRLVVVGNDKALQTRLARWRAVVGDRVRWLNAYGVSEATITSTVYDPQQSCAGTNDIVPVGRPLANTQIYLLDGQKQPVPIGAPGEIYIGGAGVGRGYLHVAHLTAEKFGANPFAPGRLYRTGDLGRFLPDGTLEFCGRVDNQIKIRGFRVEPSEIEAVLNQHPQVQQSLVIAQTEGSGHTRLVAYVAAPQTLSIKTLRNFVKERLPDYMVPSAYVKLSSLPLAATGKIDRHALPEPDASSVVVAEFTAPVGATEQKLAQIWQTLLGVQQVGREDHFFELGGHSLLVTQLFYQIEKTFATELQFQDIFHYATLAACAAKIDQQVQSPTTRSQSRYKSKAEWQAEMTLAAEIQPPTPVYLQTPATVQSIFLTGATGFLGAYLLVELLQKTNADVYCLVRAANPVEAMQRLQQTLTECHLWQEAFRPRIIPVVGDLAQPRLGLAVHQFEQLAGAVEMIYHNGAAVNFISPYDTLRPANVLGTQEVLRLAGLVKTKAVHYVSTISVFPSWMAHCEESNPLPFDLYEREDLKLEFGYMLTKWVSEKLILQAGERGFPVAIYRPSEITGHSQTGVANLRDAFCREIKSCIQLGITPDRHDWQENLVPVDYASQAIVHLSFQAAALGGIFHIIHPQSNQKNALFDYALTLGYHLTVLPLEVWKTQLVERTRSNPEIAVYPLLPFYARPWELEKMSKRLDYDCRNTLARLAGSGIVCPPVDEALLRVYFAYYRQHGGFPAPAEKLA